MFDFIKKSIANQQTQLGVSTKAACNKSSSSQDILYDKVKLTEIVVAELEREILAKEKKIEMLAQTLKIEQRSNSEKTQKLNDLANTISGLEEKVKTLTSRINYNPFNKENDYLLTKQMVIDAKKDFENLAQDEIVSKERIVKLDMLIEEHLLEHEKLVVDIELLNEKQQSIKGQETTLNEKISLEKRKIEHLEETRKDLELESFSLRDSLREKQLLLETLEEKHIRFDEEIKKSKELFLNEQLLLEKNINEVDSVKSKISFKAGELKQIEEDIFLIKEKIREEVSLSLIIKANLKDVEIEHERKNVELITLERTSKINSQEMEKLTLRIDSLNSELFELEAKIQESKNILHNQRKIAEQYRETIELISVRIDEAQREVNRLSIVVDQEETFVVEKKQLKKNLLKDELRLNEQKSSLEKCICDTQGRSNILSVEIEKKEQELIMLEKSLQELNDQKDQLKQLQDLRECQIDEIFKQQEFKEGEMISLRREIQDLELFCLKQNSELDEKKNHFRAIDINIKQLEDKKCITSLLVQQNTQDLEQLSKRIEDKKMLLIVKEEESKALQAEEQRIFSEIAKRNFDLAFVEKSIEEMQARINELKLIEKTRKSELENINNVICGKLNYIDELSLAKVEMEMQINKIEEKEKHLSAQIIRSESNIENLEKLICSRKLAVEKRQEEINGKDGLLLETNIKVEKLKHQEELLKDELRQLDKQIVKQTIALKNVTRTIYERKQTIGLIQNDLEMRKEELFDVEQELKIQTKIANALHKSGKTHDSNAISLNTTCVSGLSKDKRIIAVDSLEKLQYLSEEKCLDLEKSNVDVTSVVSNNKTIPPLPTPTNL